MHGVFAEVGEGIKKSLRGSAAHRLLGFTLDLLGYIDDFQVLSSS